MVCWRCLWSSLSAQLLKVNLNNYRRTYTQSTGVLTCKVQEYLHCMYLLFYHLIYLFSFSSQLKGGCTLCYLMHSVVTYNIIYLKYWIHVKGCATLFQTGFYHSSCFKKVHLVVISWNNNKHMTNNISYIKIVHKWKCSQEHVFKWVLHLSWAWHWTNIYTLSLSDTFICFQLCSIKYYLELCSIYNLLYNIPHANFQFICFTWPSSVLT